MTNKEPNYIITFEEGTPTKEETEKALVDLLRILCKPTVEGAAKSKSKNKEERELEQLAADLLKYIGSD